MAHTVVAVDLGASSGRVLRGVLDGGVLAVEQCHRFPNAPVHVPAGGVDDLEWDILFLWNGIRTGLAEAAKRGPVDAVGVDTWAVDYGLLDEDGRLLGNPAAYRSSRTAEPVEWVFSALSREQLHRCNGLQFQPFNTMFQLVSDTSRVRNSLAHTMLMLPDLIGHWLTGRSVCEVTNASSTGMIDPSTRRWHPAVMRLLADSFGVPVPQILPPLVEAGTVVGPVAIADIDMRDSAGGPTPLVAVGTHDTASAVVGVPAVDGLPFGFISSGTWSLVGTELDAPVLSEASRAANFTNELGVDGTVRYLKNIMGMWVQQECLREWIDQDMRNMSWAVLDAETEASEPLRTLFDINDPAFMAPDGMLGRIEDWCRRAGEPVPQTRGQVLRAITESLVVAYRRALREVVELSGRPLGVVHIVGGGSKNALLCQLTADATGLPVVAGPVEGTAIGNMVVQLRAIGALSGSLQDLRVVVAESSSLSRHEPSPGAASVWDEAEARVFSS
ncbi:rhamnulokinase [Schaalia sp. 19OD2882]|uniref:rhamnulokinase n=1 Tax=Schaalia sp. 19OD2882 TaxID=2794089 RepID=UPI001C1ED103|nr:rhamnulokinase family protein [Schaalia sp. 19OD2882]QWW19465.1 rhamnulokinase [Schaalia sp. 19OD2882]